MKQRIQRKCRCCRENFRADPRNRWHQKYCSKPACRKASKAASQHRWLRKPENQNYFLGPENVARVRAWRAEHPGYGQRPGAKARPSLQEDCRWQGIEITRELSTLPLQDVLSAQPAVLIGLIAHITASPLQEDIAHTSRRLLQLGQDILNGSALRGHPQTAHLPRAGP